MLRSIRLATLLGGLGLVCLLSAAPVEATHPRPAGAKPIRLSLVPAYVQCGVVAPNRTHGPPLAFASCNPPVQASAQATVGTPDAYGGAAGSTGHVRFNAIVGVPGPPDDGQDIPIDMMLSDVRCVPTGLRCGSANTSGPADYVGEVRLLWRARQTDHFNNVMPGGGTDPATVVDSQFPLTVPCTETSSMSSGSTCSLTTLMNIHYPGALKDGKRDLWQIFDVRVDDGGADGDGDTPADNNVFMRPGLFIP